MNIESIPEPVIAALVVVAIASLVITAAIGILVGHELSEWLHRKPAKTSATPRWRSEQRIRR